MNEKDENFKMPTKVTLVSLTYNAALKLKLNCFLHLAMEVLPSCR